MIINIKFNNIHVASCQEIEYLGLASFTINSFRVHLACRGPELRNSYAMGCPPVRGDNPRALASGLSYVQVDKHGITNLYHLHQCRPCTSRDISC